MSSPERTTSRLLPYLQAAGMATLVHGLLLLGLLDGRWGIGETVFSLLLDSLIACLLWMTVYVGLRPARLASFEILGKTFVGVSLGVWGFIGMYRALTLRDASLLAANFWIFDMLGEGDWGDGDGMGIVLLILAAVALLAALYFLGQVVAGLPLSTTLLAGTLVVVLRGIEVLRYHLRHRQNPLAEKVLDAEAHLAELALHVFVKGWIGALLMYFFAETSWNLGYVYLAWSWLHDATLRTWLWHKLGGQVQRRMGAASRQQHRTQAAETAEASPAPQAATKKTKRKGDKRVS